MLELGQALPHPLEGGGQLGKLVPPCIDDGLAEVTARDPIGCPLEAPDPAGEDRSREIADEERGREGDETGDDQTAADQVDAPQRVVERGPKQHHRPTEDRVGDLRVADPVLGGRPFDRSSPDEGSLRERVVFDVGGGHRIRIRIDAQTRRVEGDWVEVDDAGVRTVGGGLDRLVDVVVRAVQELRSDPRGRLGELVELGVNQVPLERRDDDQVDEDERRRDHDREGQAETGADASKRVHRSRKRYPTPRTVRMYSGSAGSRSSFSRK